MIKQEELKELKELIFKELYCHTSAKYFNVDSNSYMYKDFKKAIDNLIMTLNNKNKQI